MADVTKAQQRRAEARKRRRKQDEPEQESRAEPETQPSRYDGHDARHGVLQAAKVAAAAGAVGAAAAAAKALTSNGEQETAEQDAEPRGRSDAPAAEPHDPARTDEPQDVAQLEPEAEPKAQEDREPKGDERPVHGAPAGDARRAIDRGREQLEDLLGRPVEEVSSLERTRDGWVLALEVVELRRVPETTDVLASYEMELDDDLNLRRYQQARRYQRGQTHTGDER